MLNFSQLLRVPHVDSGLKFDISPDGQRLIFSWNKTGKWELWEIKNFGVLELTSQTASCLTPESNAELNSAAFFHHCANFFFEFIGFFFEGGEFFQHLVASGFIF